MGDWLANYIASIADLPAAPVYYWIFVTLLYCELLIFEKLLNSYRLFARDRLCYIPQLSQAVCMYIRQIDLHCYIAGCFYQCSVVSILSFSAM